MIFKDVTDWKEIELELREQGFTRQKLLIVRELWFRLQVVNLVKELPYPDLEDALGIVAEEYDEREEE